KLQHSLCLASCHSGRDTSWQNELRPLFLLLTLKPSTRDIQENGQRTGNEPQKGLRKIADRRVRFGAFPPPEANRKKKRYQISAGRPPLQTCRNRLFSELP